MQLPDFLLSHANPTKRILKRNIAFPQIIPFARGDLTIRKCVPVKKGRVSTPALRETRLRASLSETNANYTLTKLRSNLWVGRVEWSLKLWTKWLLYVGQACCSAYTWSAAKITRMSRSFAPSPLLDLLFLQLRSRKMRRANPLRVHDSIGGHIYSWRRGRERGISSFFRERRIIPRASPFLLRARGKNAELEAALPRIFAEHTAANVYFIIKIAYPFAARGQI